MGHVTIELKTDNTTGKKVIIINYESDSDALPMEHEDEHKRIVDKLIEGGAIKASEIGKIVINRGQEGVHIEEKREEKNGVQEGISNKG